MSSKPGMQLALGDWVIVVTIALTLWALIGGAIVTAYLLVSSATP